MPILIRLLRPTEAHVLENVAPDVFDNPVDPRWTAEFFADPRHHIVVALDVGTVIGMATGIHYVHPDKAPELFINEVGVAPPYQRQGIGRLLMEALLAHGRQLGCTGAWLGTEADNAAAQRLYQAVGGRPDEAPFVLYWFDGAAESGRP